MTEETGNESLLVLATTLAREGLFAEATKVLQKALVDGQCSEAEALDLQTRIYTHEGLDLQAQSCWQKVQHLAGLDPTYDRALGLLRRSSLYRGNVFRLSIALVVVAVLGLLLWQALFVNPEFNDRLTSNETSLAALREGLAEIKRSTQADDQELSENITKVNSNLTALGQELSKRLVELSTATGVVQEHAVAIAHLNGKIETLEKVFQHGFDRLETRHAEAKAPEVKPSPTDRISEAAPEPPKEARVSQEMVKSLSPVEDKPESKIPELRQLRMSIQQEIPSIKLSMLVYSATPRKRMIVINGRSIREGDEVASDLKLLEIVPNWAIFKFRGWTFRKGFF